MIPTLRVALTVMALALTGACGADEPVEVAHAPTPKSDRAPAPSLTPPRVVVPKVAGPTLLDLDLRLEDQDGHTRTLRDIAAGHPTLVSMFYASCTYACPTLIQDVLRIDRSLSPAARAATRILLVSFDSGRDTPAVLQHLIAQHGIPADRWVLARAPDDEGVRELAGALDITYRRLPDGNFNHTSVLVALDQAGVATARLEGLRQDATAFTAVVETLAAPDPLQ